MGSLFIYTLFLQNITFNLATVADSKRDHYIFKSSQKFPHTKL